MRKKIYIGLDVGSRDALPWHAGRVVARAWSLRFFVHACTVGRSGLCSRTRSIAVPLVCHLLHK
jgi:hypothetical protein